MMMANSQLIIFGLGLILFSVVTYFLILDLNKTAKKKTY